jgi:hypothetical protein
VQQELIITRKTLEITKDLLTQFQKGEPAQDEKNKSFQKLMIVVDRAKRCLEIMSTHIDSKQDGQKR